MNYRVLISDPLPAEAQDILEASEEIEVIVQREDLDDIIPTIHGWIVRSGTQVTAEDMERAKNLRCICRAGAGVDNVDLQAATRHGIVVMNTPGSNSRAAAEHAVALMFSVARHIPFAHGKLARGEWSRKEFVGIELQGKSVAIIGMGKVGRHVGRMAKGLGMAVFAVDPFLSPEAAEGLGFELRSMDAAIADADFLSLHTPLTDETRGFLNRDFFARCKRGIRIINCSRGGVIDEPALVEALEQGQVSGAGLDVFVEEPPSPDNPLTSHPAVVITPHIGASTREAQEQVATASGHQVRDYLCDGSVVNSVNTASLDGDDRERFAPLAELATQLGWLQSQIFDGAPRSITVELEDQDNIDMLGRIVVDHALAGFLQASSQDPVNAVNARFLARERGIEVNLRTRAQPSDWNRWVGLAVEGAGGPMRVEGAVVGRHTPRIVRFDHFTLDSPIEGPLLISSSEDRPGMVGVLGGLLGELGINIANLSLGRDSQGGNALSVLVLDELPSAETVAKIRELPGIAWVHAVRALPQ